MTIVREISEMAQQLLSERYPRTKTEVTMVQGYYVPANCSTGFTIMATVNERFHTGSGPTANKALGSLIKSIEEGL